MTDPLLHPSTRQLRPGVLAAGTAAARREFAQATPFPHVVLDDVLGVAPDDLLASFPDPQWPGWHRYHDDYQAGKLICSDPSLIPAPLMELIAELSSPEVLAGLEDLTGIGKLIPDPYLEGGGLHCSGPGGVLAPHTDFHLYRRLGLYRRINLLLYLNPGWESAWGGCLELYRSGGTRPARRVVPAWGTCVVFRTDDQSPHGFPDPIAPGRWRRSIALYYYTADETARYSGDTSTYWSQTMAHGERTRARARQLAYKGLLFGSRGIAFLAHRVDPNLSRRR